MFKILRFTDFIHLIIDNHVIESDTVIDATAGNGFDTVYLADKVGKNGKVYSFDIQEKAISNTKTKIEELNLSDRVVLIKDSHENIDKYVKNKISFCTFNLGYLPNGDKNIITDYKSTINAIQKAVSLLKKDGIITIISYTEHPSGNDESIEIEKFLHSIKNEKISLLKIETITDKKFPPKIFLIQK